MKIESITGPGGQAIWVSDFCPGAHHDHFILNASRVNFKLRDMQRALAVQHNIQSTILHGDYADKGYVISVCIVAAHKAPQHQHLIQLQLDENKSMKTAVSAFMETKYGRNVNIWRFTDALKALKVCDGTGKGYGSGKQGLQNINSLLLNKCLIGFNDAGHTALYGVVSVDTYDYLTHVKP